MQIKQKYYFYSSLQVLYVAIKSEKDAYLQFLKKINKELETKINKHCKFKYKFCDILTSYMEKNTGQGKKQINKGC